MTVSGVRIPQAVRGPGVVGDLFDLRVEGDKIASLTPSAPGTRVAGTVIPALVDLHVHLDKTYTVESTGPAFGGLFHAIETMARYQPHWTSADLTRRMDRALEEAWASGTRALRTHLDWATPRPVALDVLVELRDHWRDRLALQWVALTSVDRFEDRAFARDLGAQVREAQGILGCFVYRNEGLLPKLETVFAVAREFDLDLDFHVDEGLDADARGLEAITDLTIARGWEGRVTCGHVCSLAAQPRDEALRTLDRVATAGIRIVTLPTTNVFLQGSWSGTPGPRGVTLLREARDAGVAVSLANDNVADPFYPYGTYDLLEAWALGVQVAHLAPPEAWLGAVTVDPAQALGLGWDGRLEPGCPADFLLLDARDELGIMNPAGRRRRVCRQGVWL